MSHFKDLNEVFVLLNILDRARQWPVLMPLHNAAMEELEEIAKEVAKKLEEEAKKAAEPPKPPEPTYRMPPPPNPPTYPGVR